MNILVTNDDGIEAKGIVLLAEMAKTFGDVWVVAPDKQCSAMSHRITVTNQLEVKESLFPVEGVKAYSVSGTPADCVKVAINCILPEKPDLVMSGINFGYNSGHEIAYSGTVGAAMEALINGIPAIAYSNEPVDRYDVVVEYMETITRQILEKGFTDNEIWNINFPECEINDVKGVLWDRSIAPLQFYGGIYDVEYVDCVGQVTVKSIPKTRDDVPDGTDIAAVLDGYISVGKIKSMVM